MKAYTGWRGRAEQYRKEITRLDGHMRRLEQQNAELVAELTGAKQLIWHLIDSMGGKIRVGARDIQDIPPGAEVTKWRNVASGDYEYTALKAAGRAE